MYDTDKWYGEDSVGETHQNDLSPDTIKIFAVALSLSLL
jgi:hypothetical protein